MTSVLVVVTTAGGAERLAATRRSLDRQTDVTWEIAVVDDVASLRRAVDQASAALVTIVQAGTVLLPGALRAMHDAVSTDSTVSVADALSIPSTAHGGLQRVTARAKTGELRRRVGATHGEEPRLRVADMVHLAMPTFRRTALDGVDVGPASSPDDVIRRAARRLAERGEARLVPEVWCGRPSDDRREPRSARSMVRRVRQLLHDVRMSARWGPIRRWPRPYDIVSAPIARLSFEDLRVSPKTTGAPHIGYVLWRYPLLSETFIRREVQALREAGVALDVFALEPDMPPVPPDLASPAGTVTYFRPATSDTGRAAVRSWIRRRPFTMLRLALFVASHRQDARTKSVWADRETLRLAAHLATMLARRGITHVHVPWANEYAILAFAAAHLIGATFSVQARASEIHRTIEAGATADRVRFAQFVITNSHYNERYLRETLAPSDRQPIHVVYDALDLSQFHAVEDGVRPSGPCRLLAVGRLIGPKGFRYLLEACALLRDRGVPFSCEIIGGEQPGHTAPWVELRMLHSSLSLGSHVAFRGRQPFSEVLEAYRRADVFVLPCVRARDGSHDITPNSLLEAMAMRLPVVSTTSGAIPEIVEHESDGLLTPPADARALADALERLIRDATLRHELGRAARKKIEDRFDIARNTTQRVALFRSLQG